MRSVVAIWTVLSLSLILDLAAAQDLSKAKQEGHLVFYTSWGPGDADYVVKAFEKKYAPLRVETIRASSERTLTRLLSEQRAGTFLGDVVAVSGIQSGILKEKGALGRYLSSEAAQFPPDWRDPDGYGTGLHQTIYVIGYNSRLVSPDAAPRSYEDLLQPRWRGQLGWDPEEYYLFGALLKARGKGKGVAYWRRLAEQQINFRKGYTLISELVSAGEFPVAVSLYQHRVDEYIEKGAPLRWAAPNPLVGGDPNRISLLKNAPHPYAARIFILHALNRRTKAAARQRKKPG